MRGSSCCRRSIPRRKWRIPHSTKYWLRCFLHELQPCVTAYGVGESSPFGVAAVAGTVYFRANDGSAGDELWKSDGTEAGTVRVKDIQEGSDSSDPVGFTNVAGTLYFSANDGSYGRELWKSDGTEAGTVRVKDIRTGIYASTPGFLTNVAGTLDFSATDDSAANTRSTRCGLPAGVGDTSADSAAPCTFPQ
jgi:ELWxxDGT repeat protein